MKQIAQSSLQRSEDSEALFRDAELKGESGDDSGSFNSYLAAARLGNALCQLAVGNFYSEGRGVRRDLEEAARWYKRAYRNGLSEGALNLAVDLRNQNKIRNAIAWLKRAVAMDDGEAHLELAKVYLRNPAGVKLAVPILRDALRLGPARLTDDSRREVKNLLGKIKQAYVTKL